jgi:hypothetical protein
MGRELGWTRNVTVDVSRTTYEYTNPVLVPKLVLLTCRSWSQGGLRSCRIRGRYKAAIGGIEMAWLCRDLEVLQMKMTMDVQRVP